MVLLDLAVDFADTADAVVIAQAKTQNSVRCWTESVNSLSLLIIHIDIIAHQQYA